MHSFYMEPAQALICGLIIGFFVTIILYILYGVGVYKMPGLSLLLPGRGKKPRSMPKKRKKSNKNTVKSTNTGRSTTTGRRRRRR